MAQLRIYGIARTRAFRVLWVAKELGLPYEHIPVEKLIDMRIHGIDANFVKKMNKAS